MRNFCLPLLILFIVVLYPELSKANSYNYSESRLALMEPSDWFSDSAIAGADSRAKDEEALVALYNATNGNSWDNRRGWNGTSMSLEDDIFGVEVEKIDGELRVVLIRLNNNGSGDPKNNPLDNQGNNLTGTLPNELGNLKELRHFNVSSNHLTGTLPGGMRYCTKIERAIFELTTSDAPGAYNLPRSGVGTYNEPETVADNPLSGESGKQRGFDKWPHNNFSGTLPGEWSDWNRIKQLAVASTTIDSNGQATIEGITGSLPAEWGKMSTLQQLFLDLNKLSGKLPPEWAGMTELVDLYLDVNQLGSHTEGDPTAELPSAWGGGEGFGDGMRKLREIGMGSFISGGSASDYFNGAPTNMFDGPIPENWGNMKMLHRFAFPPTNNLKGFPAFLSSGDYADRVFNEGDWTGTDPFGNPSPNPDAIPVEAFRPDLVELTNVRNMTGSLPDPDALPELIRINAPFNSFEGEELPSNLNKWDRMIQFQVSGSGMTGKVPDITAWNSIRFIHLNSNNFSGNLPEVHPCPSSFKNTMMDNNNFTGSIPEGWDSGCNSFTSRLWVHNNNLSGAIPPGLANSKHTYTNGFRIDGNRYVFKDLVPFIKLGPSNFQYAPQQAFGSAKNYYLSEGESITIDDFNSVVTHSGNRYRWQKDGADISGATSRTLSIASFSPADQGVYTLVVTNPAAPELTLTSHKITLTIGDGGNKRE